jgi:DNA-binding IclR family transcriptional regulator
MPQLPIDPTPAAVLLSAACASAAGCLKTVPQSTPTQPPMRGNRLSHAMTKASVKSAIRVLEVFEQFGEAQGPLRLKDVAARLGYPVSSTAALLKSISDRGYLTFDRRSRQYFPTNKIPELGLRLSTAAFEGQALMDTMEALRDATSEFVVVGTPNDIYVDYIKSLRSTQPIQFYSPAGTRRLMVQSGMGLLLLSRMPDAVALRIYRHTVAAGAISPQEFSELQLLDQLRTFRERNYVFTRSSDFVRISAHAGGAIVAMIVPTPPNYRSLVLAVGGPAERLEKNLSYIVCCMKTELNGLSKSHPIATPFRVQS